jgi:hypothetical protein
LGIIVGLLGRFVRVYWLFGMVMWFLFVRLDRLCHWLLLPLWFLECNICYLWWIVCLLDCTCLGKDWLFECLESLSNRLVLIIGIQSLLINILLPISFLLVNVWILYWIKYTFLRFWINFLLINDLILIDFMYV